MDYKASFSTDPYAPDRLIAGNHHLLVGRTVTIASGQTLLRGAVLGAILLGAVTVAFAGTGDGVLTMDATTPVLPGAKPGAYTATCIATATDGGTFRVEDPDGFVLGDVAVGDTFSDGIKFVIADGSADFTVGAKFTITIAAGSAACVLSLAAAVDGSQTPDLILAEDCDASGGAKTALAYQRGDFNANALTIGTGHTVASIREGLRAKGITILPALAA